MDVTEFCITLSVLFCQGVAYENIGLNESAWQQFPFYVKEWGAERAVDGLYSDLSAFGGQCVISDDSKSTAEWRLDLGRIHILHHIVIHYRTEHIDSDINVYASRFLGFSVFVSNTTDKEDGILCFMDMNYTIETIPNPINITCPNQESGRYVIYYNNRTHPPYPDGFSNYAHNELCEMEVFSCPYGFFGKDCTDKCNYTCTGCNDVDGSCDSGCHPGWFGNYCNKACAIGTYGIECRETCGNCRDVNQCINNNGTCLGGCKDGFQGILCKSPCNTGSYGVDCKEKCGNCLDVYKCSYTNGTCLNGCVAGFQGNLCKTPCRQGFFGKNCSHTCIKTCNGCNNVNGLCDSGCLLGWRGYFCSELYGCTPKGYFGSNCSIPCPDVNCQECHIESGTCHVCKQGYKGQRCETVSELADFINNIKFYSFLGAFCLSLTVIGILIGYNIMIRKRQLTQHQPSDLQGSRDVNLPNVSRDYDNCEELRELRRSEIYDTIQ